MRGAAHQAGGEAAAAARGQPARILLLGAHPQLYCSSPSLAGWVRLICDADKYCKPPHGRQCLLSHLQKYRGCMLALGVFKARLSTCVWLQKRPEEASQPLMVHWRGRGRSAA